MEKFQSCRICLQENLREALSFFEVAAVSDLTFSEVYHYVTGFSIEETGPQNLCPECSMELSSAYLFKKKCENNESLFQRKAVKQEPFEEMEVDVKFFDSILLEPKIIKNWNYEEEKSFADKCNKRYNTRTSKEACDGTLFEPKKRGPYNKTKRECEICGKNFRYRRDFESHKKNFHQAPSDETIICPDCGKSLCFTAIPYHFKVVHKKTLTGELIACPYNCGSSVKLQSLGGHINMFHAKSDTGAYICHYCSNKYNSKTAIAHHLRYQHRTKWYKCKKCDKAFKEKSELTSHHEDAHTRKYISETTICTQCGKSLNVRSLPYHMKTIHEKTDTGVYICDLCNNKYTTKNSILNHMRYQHLKKYRNGPYSCRYCSEIFEHLASRRWHEVKVHTKDYKYKCSFCDMKFISNSRHKNHLMTHTGEKNLSCPTCGMKFAQKYTLKLHIETHATTNDFFCKFCNAVFKTSKSLKRHETTHREKRFKCAVCRKRFLIERMLVRHYSKAHPEYEVQQNGTMYKEEVKWM